MLRWLAVAGAVLAFVVSLVMVGDYWWSSFHNLLSNVSAFGRAESGLKKLGQFEYQDKNGVAYGRLGDDETGFRKLKAIILGKRPEYRERQISAIISTEGMAYNLGEGTVAQKYVGKTGVGSCNATYAQFSRLSLVPSQPATDGGIVHAKVFCDLAQGVSVLFGMLRRWPFRPSIPVRCFRVEPGGLIVERVR